MKNMMLRLLALPFFAFSLVGMSGIDIMNEPTDEAAVITTMKTLHDFTALTIEGEELDLSTFKGKKVLIVNTASECGLTPQYEMLQELHNEYVGDNFAIIGFPSNDFGGQEPGSDKEIAAFCQKNYGVTFQMMSKVKVKGDGIHPVYKWLTSKAENGVSDYEVKWNFHKFLVDADGKLVKAVDPQTLPVDEEITSWVSK